MMRINSNYQARNGDREESDLEHLRKLFIGGLAPITTEESLKSFYEQWGEVTDSVVMKDPATKRSRGFGFITYASPVMVDKAQNARPHIIDGKTVDAKRALPRPELNNPEANAMVKKVFVGGLKENHDEPTLHEYFSQFGNVVGVKILTDRLTGRKRGFAFVEFDDYDAVDKAVLQKHHSIKYVLVDVKKSAYKQEVQRKHNLLAQQQQVQGQGMPQHPQQSYQQMMPQVPQQAGYNGWGYGQPAYQQPPPHQQAQVPNYNYAPQNGTPAAAWNAAPPAAYQTSWNQNGYGAPPSGIPPPAAATAVGPPPATNWNGTQNFGDYQQAYNGGPTKAGNLTGNRMNPYNVPATANYGNVTPVSYNYSTTPQGYVGMYGGSPNNVSIPTNTQQSLKVLQTKTTVGPTNNHRY